MELPEITGILDTAKTVLGIAREAKALLPAGNDRDSIEKKLNRQNQS